MNKTMTLYWVPIIIFLYLFDAPCFAIKPSLNHDVNCVLKIIALDKPEKIGNKISQATLPDPYDYLLTQPLMTKGIATYYHRTPIIQVMYAQQNKEHKTYSRVIVMLIDNNKARNDPVLAQKKNDVMVVELAFITINFSQLPQSLITDVLHTNTPFGQLLLANHIQTSSINRTYFSVPCNKTLSSLTDCKLDSVLYGRTNTLIRVDNHQWVAHVVEILR